MLALFGCSCSCCFSLLMHLYTWIKVTLLWESLIWLGHNVAYYFITSRSQQVCLRFKWLPKISLWWVFTLSVKPLSEHNYCHTYLYTIQYNYKIPWALFFTLFFQNGYSIKRLFTDVMHNNWSFIWSSMNKFLFLFINIE